MNNSKRILQNASWIIVCKVLQGILSFLLSIFTARFLGPTNFGSINYAASLVAFAVPIVELGFSAVLVSEIVSNNNEGDIMGTAISLSLISSVICFFGIFAFASLTSRNEKESIVVCILYSFIIFFQAMELSRYWFQAHYYSKYTSLISLSAYLLCSIYKITLLVLKKGIYWFAISNALDSFLIAMLSMIAYRKLGGDSFHFSKNTAKRLLRRGFPYILSSLSIVIFSNTDKVMIRNILDEANVAFYSVAFSICTLTSFFFTAIIDSVRPVVLKNSSRSEEAFCLSLKRLYSVVIYISILQSVFIFFLSKILVLLLYGDSYRQAIPAMRVLTWFSCFSYIGAVNGVWILAKEMQRYLWILNVLGSAVNIVLNILLIPRIGIVGAAIASLISQFINNIVLIYFIKPLRGCSLLLFESFNPKYLLGFFKIGDEAV